MRLFDFFLFWFFSNLLFWLWICFDCRWIDYFFFSFLSNFIINRLINNNFFLLLFCRSIDSSFAFFLIFIRLRDFLLLFFNFIQDLWFRNFFLNLLLFLNRRRNLFWYQWLLLFFLCNFLFRFYLFLFIYYDLYSFLLLFCCRNLWRFLLWLFLVHILDLLFYSFRILLFLLYFSFLGILLRLLNLWRFLNFNSIFSFGLLNKLWLLLFHFINWSYFIFFRLLILHFL